MDGYITLKDKNINHIIETFYLNEYPNVIKQEIYCYTFYELFTTFPKLCMTNNLEKGGFIFTNRMKLCSTLYNIKKISKILDLENETPKYSYWKENYAVYFNII